MSSASGSRRGPKGAHCPRSASRKPAENVPRSSAKSCYPPARCNTRVISAQQARDFAESQSDFSENNASQNSVSSTKTSITTTSSAATFSSGPSTWTSRGFLSAEQTVMAPDMTIQHGDRKESYQLADKGKLVMINRKNGDIVYMLRCVDGRSVYIEKTGQGACLILTNQKGKITKALAGAY